jgi:agmatine deiminase
MTPAAIGKPADYGYRVPAEWEPHDAMWFTWPHNAETFPEHLAEAQATIARCVRELTRPRTGKTPERADILVRNPADRAQAKQALQFWDVPDDAYALHEINNNDVWIRDYGPIFIRSDDPKAPAPLAAVNFHFDAWGGKDETYYGARAGTDDRICAQICEDLGIPRFDVAHVLEGGAIESNGERSCLTTKNCLITRDRKRDAKQWETILHDQLGFENVLWLDGVNFDADDTQGHIDNLTRFVGPQEVITVVSDNKTDPGYDALSRNVKQLEKMRDSKGRPLDIIPLKLPTPFYLNAIMDGVRDRRRYPASYANFIIGNAVVLVPIFSDANDAAALDTLSVCFPEREIVPIDCSRYILGQGALHCSSQQQPAI